MPYPAIRRLSHYVVDLIAAGEVVERPAAALKELVENALDAGATRLEVSLRGGGCDSIDVADNGCGMTPEELPLAVERHCTSKLQNDDLVHIQTLGFRGEALPSIGASARLNLISRTAASDSAWCLRVEGGVVEKVMPAAGAVGTRVVVRDLFFATPARRKFLKSPRVEGNHAEAVMRRMALSSPQCAMTFQLEGREILRLPVQTVQERVAAVLGVAVETLLEIYEQRGHMTLSGFMCGPGHTRATGSGQFLLVNNRPVMDPVLRTAVRVAYRSVIERGRFPVLMLHLHVPFDRVDVNVHPAKTELRFADEADVRAFIIGAVGRVLSRGANEGGGVDVQADMMRRALSVPPPLPIQSHAQSEEYSTATRKTDLGFGPSLRHIDRQDHRAPKIGELGFSETAAVFDRASPLSDVQQSDYCREQQSRECETLGVAIGQIHATYILALAENGDLILVDQHAAHERLTHERLRACFEGGEVKAQALLLPEVVDLAPAGIEAVLSCREELAQFGLEIESFGAGSIMIRSIPAPLKGGDVGALLRDIAEELVQDPDVSARQTESLDRRFESVVARMACHGSIRAGRILKREEMDRLLCDMAQNPRANTCPHGRPTWLRFSRNALEKLFGRIK